VPSFDDALWRKVFEFSSEQGLCWAVRFKNETERVRYSEDPKSCYNVNHEPIAPHRIEDRGLKDGAEGPLLFSEILWLRFPGRVRAGSGVGIRTDREFDLPSVQAALAIRPEIPFEATSDFIHIGERDT
jgi:hypothetical protein